MPFAMLAAVAAGFVADGTVRAEGRGGSSVGGQDPNAAGILVDLLGRASGPDGVLRVGLSPSAVRAQGNQLFVRGFAEGELRLRESAHLRLRQALGYGSLDLSPVATVSGPGPVRTPAGTAFATVQESTTSLEADAATSRRLRWTGSAAWVVAGGADADARTTFPLRRGPLLRGSAEWAATQTDLLRFTVEGFDYRYSNDQRSSVVSLAGGWQTRFERGTELALSLGPAIGRTRRLDRSEETLLYAVGTLDLRSAPARDVSAVVGGGIEPLGDSLTGDLVERGSLRASVTWDRHRVVAITARLVGSVALTSGSGGPTSPQAGDRYLQAEASVSVPIDARSTVAAGLRAAFLSRPVLDQPSNQWVAFVRYVAQLPLSR